MAFDAEQVRQIAERVATSYGLEVVEVELRGGGKARRLRIVIDKPVATAGATDLGEIEAGATEILSGVTHEDCVRLSREVGTILDVEDVMSGAEYTLEVSSPGLDRKLFRAEDYERFRGSLVKLTTRHPVNGNRHFEGRLQDFKAGRLKLDVGEARKQKQRPAEGQPQTLEIELANVEKANLVPEI